MTETELKEKAKQMGYTVAKNRVINVPVMCRIRTRATSIKTESGNALINTDRLNLSVNGGISL